MKHLTLNRWHIFEIKQKFIINEIKGQLLPDDRTKLLKEYKDINYGGFYMKKDPL